MNPYRESTPDHYCRLFAPSTLKDPDRRDALSDLGEAMLDSGGTASNPGDDEYLADAGYTYFGQFIDHDLTEMSPLPPPSTKIARDRELTATAPSKPPLKVNVATDLKNLQTPKLDLSHLYGGGPSDENSKKLYENDGVRLKIGPRSRSGAGRSFDVSVDPDGRPLLADGRSTENLIIREMVAVFARLHNAAVEQWRGMIGDPVELFEQARKQTVWQFQYLVVEDYLRRMLYPTVFTTVFEDGRPTYEWKNPASFSIPVEFAVGAFRFGHSMVRLSYVFSIEGGVLDFPLGEIFERALQPGQLEEKWEIRWGCFFQGAGHTGSDGRADSTLVTNRPIDTLIAKPLHDLLNPSLLNALTQLFPITQIPLPIRAGKFKLPVRTLLRGESMRLASGQTAADAFGIDRLTADQLTRERGGPMNPHKPHEPILRRAELLNHTPLWYYVLKESEIACNGSRLGPVGSHIVAETISAALRYDCGSYFYNPEPPGSREWRLRNRLRLSSPPIWRIGGKQCQIYNLTKLFSLAPALPVD